MIGICHTIHPSTWTCGATDTLGGRPIRNPAASLREPDMATVRTAKREPETTSPLGIRATSS
jgi:hypothetical protein